MGCTVLAGDRRVIIKGKPFIARELGGVASTPQGSWNLAELGGSLQWAKGVQPKPPPGNSSTAFDKIQDGGLAEVCTLSECFQVSTILNCTHNHCCKPHCTTSIEAASGPYNALTRSSQKFVFWGDQPALTSSNSGNAVWLKEKKFVSVFALKQYENIVH